MFPHLTHSLLRLKTMNWDDDDTIAAKFNAKSQHKNKQLKRQLPYEQQQQQRGYSTNGWLLLLTVACAVYCVYTILDGPQTILKIKQDIRQKRLAAENILKSNAVCQTLTGEMERKLAAINLNDQQKEKVQQMIDTTVPGYKAECLQAQLIINESERLQVAKEIVHVYIWYPLNDARTFMKDFMNGYNVYSIAIWFSGLFSVGTTMFGLVRYLNLFLVQGKPLNMI